MFRVVKLLQIKQYPQKLVIFSQSHQYSHQIICTNFAETNILLKCISTYLTKALLVALLCFNKQQE